MTRRILFVLAVVLTLALSAAILALPRVVIANNLTVAVQDAAISVGGNTRATYSLGSFEKEAVRAQYESSDESVAVVDERGIVTAVSPGTATIIIRLSLPVVGLDCGGGGGGGGGCFGSNPSGGSGDISGEASVTVTPTPAPAPPVLTLEDIALCQYTAGTLHLGIPADYTGTTAGTWAVADGSIASIDQQGNVTGLLPGDTTVTFTLEGGVASAQCSVRVEPLFTLSPEALTLYAGVPQNASVSYSALYAGTQAGTWQSSDPSAVVVSQTGEVTALLNEAGQASVTYTDAETQATGTVAVTVKPAFTLSPDPLSLKQGEKESLTVVFDAGYTGPTAGVWSIADAGVAAIDANGLVSGKKAGTTEATFTLDGSGAKASAQVIVSETKCTVTFDANGGSPSPASVTVLYNSRISEPAAPERGGYDFAGWCTAAEGGTKWTFTSDRVRKDMTLHAQWTPRVIIVTPPSDEFRITAPKSMRDAFIGEGYESPALTVVGGAAPYSFSIGSGALPEDLSIDSATGSISGTIAEKEEYLDQTFTFTVVATDANGLKASKRYSITVLGSILLEDGSYAGVLIGAEIDLTLVGSGGAGGPYTIVPAGTLPDWLDFDGTSLTGTAPDAAGNYYIDFLITDSHGNTAIISVWIWVYDEL